MASKVYVNDETQITIGTEVGDDYACSTESITDGNGRQSATADLGAAPRAFTFEAFTEGQFQATPTLGSHYSWWAKPADGEGASPGTFVQDDGTGDIALSSLNKLSNCIRLVTSVVDEAAANIVFAASAWPVLIWARHVAFIFENQTGATSDSVAADAPRLRLTPKPLEGQ